MYDHKSFTFEHIHPWILLYLHQQRSHLCKRNVRCNLLYRIILLCCCANVLGWRIVDRDNFTVYKHLLCKKKKKKRSAWWSITVLASCEIHFVTKVAKFWCFLLLFLTAEEKYFFLSSKKEKKQNKTKTKRKVAKHFSMFTSSVSMPQIFAQFKQTDTHLSVLSVHHILHQVKLEHVS